MTCGPQYLESPIAGNPRLRELAGSDSRKLDSRWAVVSVTRTEPRYLDRRSASAGASIDVSAVVDRDDLDHMPFLVDPIKDAVLTAPSSPQALKFKSEWLAHPSRCVRDVVDRLKHSRSHSLLESIEVTSCRWHDLDTPSR